MGCAHSSCITSDECENDGRNQMGRWEVERSAMNWSLNLIGKRRRRGRKVSLENNKAWLLGESGGEVRGGSQMESADPQSMHSSFRFSFGSQVELESLNLNSTAATVLLLNLEKGSQEESLEARCKELQMRRIESLERNVSAVAAALIRFTFAEIRSATNDFCRDMVLGRGAHSCVFRGRLRFGRAVAIKRLDNDDKDSAKDFCRELMIASSLDHRNVVPLIGFCIYQDGLFLVYKYVSGGSLEHHLHEKGRKKGYSLPWSSRFKVAVGVAEAIAYLHNGTEKCVIHRDIKPSNILLSSKKTPKLCDFGLATWTPAPSTPFLCKTVKGTFGYLAPEYFQHGKVSDKTDVYAFGVVLLELITGRKPIETGRSQGDENLVSWAVGLCYGVGCHQLLDEDPKENATAQKLVKFIHKASHHKAKPLLQQGGCIGELLDPRLSCSSNSLSQVSLMIQTAAACVNCEESQRPSINQVITMLRGEEHLVTGKSSFSRNGCIGFYPQSHDAQTKHDVNGHLALAMLGVTEFDEDDFYCR